MIKETPFEEEFEWAGETNDQEAAFDIMDYVHDMEGLKMILTGIGYRDMSYQERLDQAKLVDTEDDDSIDKANQMFSEVGLAKFLQFYFEGNPHSFRNVVGMVIARNGNFKVSEGKVVKEMPKEYVQGTSLLSPFITQNSNTQENDTKRRF